VTVPAAADSPRVLVVDDEPPVCTALCRLLERASLDTTGFNDPFDAAKAAREEPFALVLSDYLMPGMTGLELLREVARAVPLTRRILITGYADLDQAIDAFNEGVIHRFIRKPWSNEELVEVCREEVRLFQRANRSHQSRHELERLVRRRTQLLRTAMDLVREGAGELLEDEDAPEETAERPATVLITDVVGYSRLIHDNPTETLETLTAHQMLLFGHITRHGGRVVDAPGDNMLAEFPNPGDAVRAAITAQQELTARAHDQAPNRQMWFRMGIAHGEVLVRGGELFGDAVNIAARLQALAQPGGVCVSHDAYRRLPEPERSVMAALGEQRLKNIPRPVPVYHWPEVAKAADSAP